MCQLFKLSLKNSFILRVDHNLVDNIIRFLIEYTLAFFVIKTVQAASLRHARISKNNSFAFVRKVSKVNFTDNQ